MRKWICFLNLVTLFFSASIFAAEKIIVLQVNGAIGPATQDYIQRGIQAAAKEKTPVIIELNTPGGLETAMRGINEAIIDSPVPIITYVYPAGARAASAGTFIMYASHVAAMAPGTNIGAASPVSITPTNNENKTKEMNTHEKKAMNDATAYIRSLAQLRGRNVEWAERAVRTAESLSAADAKRLNVINEVAVDYPDLLQKLDGRTIQLNHGSQTLHTKNIALQKVLPDWRYQFLAFITNPNIAYLLMLLAIYGIFFELSNPGLILPGVAGVIALLLVLYAFQLMPINYAGLTLVLIGITFIIGELYISSYGALGIGGVIAFIIGSIMLFDTADPHFKIAWTSILIMSIMTAAFFLMVVKLAINSQRKAVVTGTEALVGAEGVVIEKLKEKYLVRVFGEIWEATSVAPLTVGQRVKVKEIRGLLLFVESV